MRPLKWFVLTLVSLCMTIGTLATAYAQGSDTSRGAQLYVQNCAACHGDRAQGGVGTTLAKDFVGIRVDALLKQIISNGVPGSVMPPWSRAQGGLLNDVDIDAMVTYIRSLGKQVPTAPTSPIVATTKVAPPSPTALFPSGDATRGAALYVQNCAVCHGERGEGRIGATLQKDWSGISVESSLISTMARGIAGSKMPAWSRENGGALTYQEIADIAGFTRSLQQHAPPALLQTPSVPRSGSIDSTGTLVCLGLIVALGGTVPAFFLASTRTRT